MRHCSLGEVDGHLGEPALGLVELVDGEGLLQEGIDPLANGRDARSVEARAHGLADRRLDRRVLGELDVLDLELRPTGLAIVGLGRVADGLEGAVCPGVMEVIDAFRSGGDLGAERDVAIEPREAEEVEAPVSVLVGDLLDPRVAESPSLTSIA